MFDGLEGKSGEIGKRSHRCTFIETSQRLRGIFNNRNVPFGGNAPDGVEIAWEPTVINTYDGFGFLIDKVFYAGWIDVKRFFWISAKRMRALR